jgi:hypothetical protein
MMTSADRPTTLRSIVRSQRVAKTREGRSLLVDHHVDSELTQGGTTRPQQRGRLSRRGGAARIGGGDPRDHPPPEKHVRKVSNNVCTPAAFWIRQ